MGVVTFVLWPRINKCCETDPGYAEYEYYAQLATDRDIRGLKYMFENDMQMGLPNQASYYALLGALEGDSYLTEKYVELYPRMDVDQRSRDKEKIFKNTEMKGARVLAKRLRLETGE